MRTLFLFIALVVILFFGSSMLEGFTDSSGATITISLSELLQLLTHFSMGRQDSGASTPSTPSTPASQPADKPASQPCPSPAAQPCPTVDDTILSDCVIDSFAQKQGSDFLRFVPGKNPADYIRKDSIPCYGCTLP